MSSKDYTVRAIDGLKLVTKTHELAPGTALKGKIVFVHGFSEHISVYDQFLPRFAEHGYEVTIFDQRGHGHTARDQSDFGATNDYYSMKDIDSIVQFALEGYDGPAFLWGHSMGGGLSLTYLTRGRYRDRFSGFIASSPYVQGHPNVSGGLKAKLLPVMYKIAPSYREKLPLKPEWSTDDPSKIAWYTGDPLRHNIGSVSLVYDMIKRGKDLLSPEPDVELLDRPVLICQGDADPICLYAGTVKAFEHLRNKDKQLLTYPGKPHELHMLKDDETAQYGRDVLQWLDKFAKPVDFSAIPPPESRPALAT